MGVDYEYCSKCEESLNEYCFNGCIICEERCNYSDDCEDDYLITLKKHRVSCVMIVLCVLINLIYIWIYILET